MYMYSIYTQHFLWLGALIVKQRKCSSIWVLLLKHVHCLLYCTMKVALLKSPSLWILSSKRASSSWHKNPDFSSSMKSETTMELLRISASTPAFLHSSKIWPGQHWRKMSIHHDIHESKGFSPSSTSISPLSKVSD